MKRSLALLTLLAAGAAVAPASADPTGQLAVRVDAPDTAACDQPFDITGAVTLAGVAGVPRQTVRVTLGGTVAGYGPTGTDGTFTLRVESFPPGTYTVGGDIFKGLPLETTAAPSSITITGTCGPV